MKRPWITLPWWTWRSPYESTEAYGFSKWLLTLEKARAQQAGGGGVKLQFMRFAQFILNNHNAFTLGRNVFMSAFKQSSNKDRSRAWPENGPAELLGCGFKAGRSTKQGGHFSLAKVCEMPKKAPNSPNGEMKAHYQFWRTTGTTLVSSGGMRNDQMSSMGALTCPPDLDIVTWIWSQRESALFQGQEAKTTTEYVLEFAFPLLPPISFSSCAMSLWAWGQGLAS